MNYFIDVECLPYVYVYDCACTCVCVFPWWSEENTELLRAGVSDSCKLPDVCAGNGVQVLLTTRVPLQPLGTGL